MLALQHPDGRLAACHTSAQTDPSLCVHSMLRAQALTGNPRYGDAIERHQKQLLTTFWHSKQGILYHFVESKRLWADTAAMLPPALAALGMEEMAFRQMTGLLDQLRLSNGLYGHQWNDAAGAWDRIVPWSAGNGWVLVGLAWTVERLGREHPMIPTLLSLYTDLTEALRPYQTDDGLYHDIATDESTFIECQTAAMQQYSRLVLLDLGLFHPWEATPEAHRILTVIEGHMDTLGVVRDAPGAPDFAHNGSSTEMQAFYLMLWQRLHPQDRIVL